MLIIGNRDSQVCSQEKELHSLQSVEHKEPPDAMSAGLKD